MEQKIDYEGMHMEKINQLGDLQTIKFSKEENEYMTFTYRLKKNGVNPLSNPKINKASFVKATLNSCDYIDIDKFS